jgi:hypothetical protein
MVRNRHRQTSNLTSSSMPPTPPISALRLHHRASLCDRPARSDILRHVLRAADTGYGRLSILTVPRSQGRHLRRLSIDSALLDHQAHHRVHEAAEAEEWKPQTRLSRSSCNGWHSLEQGTAMFGSTPSDPGTTKGALFPPLTRLEMGPAGTEDYCYGSAVLLLIVMVRKEQLCMGRIQGMQHVKGSPLPALSRPTSFGAE